MLATRSIETTETSKSRQPQPMKAYSADNFQIPLKKNWLEAWQTLPQSFDSVLPNMLDYAVRSDDVFVVTFPKCGTTWMQETLWLIMNNLDFTKSKENFIETRSPYLEKHGLRLKKTSNRIEFSQTLPSPRLLKSHLPANLLPCQIWESKTKIVYVARNCKDVIVSFYHFSKNMGLWLGDNLNDFVEDFLNNEILYTNYWTHVLDFWKMRNESFIFFVTYEEMKRDLAGVLQKLCEFVGKPQLTQEEMEKMLKHLSFESMRENNRTNMTSVMKTVPGVSENLEFMRRGIVGSYKDELTAELSSKIDAWSRAYLAQHGLIEEDIFGKL